MNRISHAYPRGCQRRFDPARRLRCADGCTGTRARFGDRPGETAGRVVQIRRLSRGCASYIVSDGKECAIIDPSSRIDEYVGLAATKDFRITHVIDTHKHADHISGGRALASATGAELHLSPLDSYHFEGYRPLLDKHKEIAMRRRLPLAIIVVIVGLLALAWLFPTTVYVPVGFVKG